MTTPTETPSIQLTRTQRRNLARFADPKTIEIGENEIAGMRKAYNAVALEQACRRDLTPRYVALREYVGQLESIFKRRTFRVTAKQSAKGLKWLRNLQWTPTGKKRLRAPMNEWQEKALATFTHFEFTGFDEEWQGHRSFFTPIYKLVGTAASFSYAARAWQSGGVPFTVL